MIVHHIDLADENQDVEPRSAGSRLLEAKWTSGLGILHYFPVLPLPFQVLSLDALNLVLPRI